MLIVNVVDGVEGLFEMFQIQQSLDDNDGRSNPKSAMPIPDQKNMRSVRYSADSDARMFF